MTRANSSLSRLLLHAAVAAALGDGIPVDGDPHQLRGADGDPLGLRHAGAGPCNVDGQLLDLVQVSEQPHMERMGCGPQGGRGQGPMAAAAGSGKEREPGGGVPRTFGIYKGLQAAAFPVVTEVGALQRGDSSKALPRVRAGRST
jgi:hypothetical protein